MAAVLVLASAAIAAAGCAGNGSAERDAVRLMQEGIHAGREGDTAHAAELFEEAALARPGFVDPLMFLANLQERNGDLETARATYTRVLETDPTLTAAGVALALTYLRDGRIDEGRTWLVKSIDADPGYEPAAFNLGALAERTGESGEAAAWYRLAAVLDDRSPVALVRLGRLRLSGGNAEAARAAAREALRRVPNHPDATALLRATSAED